MPNGFSSSCPIADASPPPPIAARNAAEIIREAIKLPLKNDKVLLQVILLVLSPSALLVLLHYLIAGPLLQKVEDSYERSSLDPKDVRAVVGIEIPFFVAFCVVSFLATRITIYASVMTYTGKSATLKDLMLWILSTTWKKAIITWLYVSLLTVAYVLLSVGSIQLIGLIATTACNWLMGTLAVLFYPFFASLCTLGLVISTAEDDCYGAKALGKAPRLIKGRKLLGFVLMLTLVLLSLPIYILFYVVSTDDDDEIGSVTRFGFMLFATLLFCLTNFFTLVVYTVFYFECKQSLGDGPGTGTGYHSMLITSTTD